MYHRTAFNHLVLCSLALAFLVSCGRSGTDNVASPEGTAPTSAEALLDEVKKVVASKDIEKLVALGHWEGVPNKYPDLIREHMTGIFEYTNPSYSISEMTPQEMAKSEIRGKTLTWNIQPYAWITIASGNQGSKIPIGIKNGMYYVATKLEE